MENNVIEVTTVTKRFGEVDAVNGVDMTIRKGEIFGLIGHNGAGKSTLFKMMLGLLPVSSGEIRIKGQAIHGGSFREVRSKIGYLPENVAFYDNLTGIETLRFFADLKGVEHALCGRVLDKVGLGYAANRRVRTYSKGMRQRLGFAQALLGDPDLLFLDEPTNGLDPEGIREFYLILNEMKLHGVTIILTSHILAEIQERVDRLAIMKLGKIQVSGTVQELRNKMLLPLVFNITVTPGGEDEVRQVLESLNLSVLSGPVGRISANCPRSMKMRVLMTLAKYEEKISDIQIHEPSLEDLFLGYSA